MFTLYNICTRPSLHDSLNRAVIPDTGAMQCNAIMQLSNDNQLCTIFVKQVKVNLNCNARIHNYALYENDE